MYNGATKTQIVLNETEISMQHYNLQFKLDYLACNYSNLFLIAVFDCCRERKDAPKTKGDAF